MPGNPSLMELIYIACLIYGDMCEASDNAVPAFIFYSIDPMQTKLPKYIDCIAICVWL